MYVDFFHSSHKHFDIERLKRVASTFQGYHDFRTFMSVTRGNDRQHDPTFTLRSIEHISIDRGISMASAFNQEIAERYYEYWDIRIKGRSFLYKQVLIEVTFLDCCIFFRFSSRSLIITG